MDAIITRAWQTIFDGNSDSPNQLIERFVKKHAKRIHRGKEYEPAPIIGQLVYEAYCGASKSVGGLDGWEPAELALFSLKVCEWIAELYKLIESGAPWPS